MHIAFNLTVQAKDGTLVLTDRTGKTLMWFNKDRHFDTRQGGSMHITQVDTCFFLSQRFLKLKFSICNIGNSIL